MEVGRKYNKSITNPEGTGLTDFGFQAITRDKPLIKATTSIPSRNPHYEGETDSSHTLTGAGDGNSIVGSTKTEKYGFNSSSGSSIILDDTPGGETISLKHHSGASVLIDPDGFISITSSARKGIGISAPYGDAFLSASGDIAITGASITATTTGDYNLVVGGNYNIKCGGYKLTTNIMDETVDGSYSKSVTNDSSVIIGGLNRYTVAGDSRTQVSGSNTTDVLGDSLNRTTGDTTFHVTGALSIASKGDNEISSDGQIKVVSSGNMTFSSKSALTAASEGATTISAAGALDTRGSTAKMSADGNVSIEGSGSARVVGSTATIGGSTVNIATSTLNSPVPSGSGGSASPSVSSTTATLAIVDVSKAETMEANDIIDELTSVRKYPDYPKNAKLESADAGAISTVSHDQSSSADSVYNEYSSKNHGNVSPVSEEIYGDVPEINDSERPDNIEGIEPDISVPSQHSTSSKISKYFTLGQFTNATLSHKIPASIYENVVKNHIYLAYNVMDQIKLKFPDVIISSVWRENSPNHKTGLAIDIVVPSRSLEIHAEIARYARDNLPVDQVFLEKNTSGRTHVHLRATKEKGGSPRTMTCADPQCYSNVPGIQTGYLTKRGVK